MGDGTQTTAMTLTMKGRMGVTTRSIIAAWVLRTARSTVHPVIIHVLVQSPDHPKTAHLSSCSADSCRLRNDASTFNVARIIEHHICRRAIYRPVSPAKGQMPLDRCSLPDSCHVQNGV